MKLDKARMGIYLLAGLYLIYLTYSIFRDIGMSGENPVLIMIFAVFLGIAGIVLVALSLWTMYRDSKGRQQDSKDQENEEE